MKRFTSKPLAAAIIAAGMSGSGIATAQAKELMLEEVVVTARQKAETLQKVPLSVHALTARQIERQGILGLTDVVRSAPGVAINSSGSIATTAVVIRGMDQPGGIGQDTNVAVFVDGVYISGRDAAYMPMMGMERVEVVRGPQSALYGRNAFAGAINYITKKPGEEFEGQIEATAGLEGQKGIKARFAGQLAKNFFASIDAEDSESGSTHKQDGDYLGQLKNESVRARFVWEASDNLEFDLSLTRLDIQETPQAGTEIAHNAWTRLEGRYPFPTPLLDISDYQRYAGIAEDAAPTGVLDEAEGTKFEADRVSLSFNWDLEHYGLTSITGYNDSKTRAVTGYDSTYVGDYYFAAPKALVAGAWGLTAAHPAQLVDLTPFVIGSLPPPAAAAITGAGLGIYEAQDVSYQTIGGQPNHNREEFSQEFRMQSQLSGPLNWMAGISYSDLDLDEWLSTSVLNPGDALSQALLTFDLMHMEYDGNEPNILTLTKYGTKTESAFFSLEYAVTEKLTVTAEGRYTNEEKSAEDTVSDLAGSLGALIPAVGRQQDTWEYFSPRVTASYEWDEDTLFYANIGQGTKSGGFNGGASGDKAKYDEETNTTYEIGAKRTVLDGRGYMNLSAYFIDWDDQQIREFAGSGAPGVPRVVVANLGKTDVKGLEMESAFQIDESWSFRMGYTYNDSEIKEGIVATDVGFTDFAALGMDSIANGCTLFGGAPIPGTACANGPPFFSYVNDLAVSDGNSSGNQSPNTHKHTVNAGFTYTTNLNMGAEFYASIDAVWKDKRYLDAANTLMIDDYTDVNLQLGLNGEHWYGKISAVNLLDDDTPTSAYRPGLWDGSFQQTVINRNGRMVAFSVGYRF